jgi:hypothetical protein
MFAPLPSVMLKCDGDHTDDVLQFLQHGTADQGPTSSSSDVQSGSSGRDSATPGIASGTSAAVSQSATGASWLQMAPQMGAMQPASAPVMYSMGTQPQHLQHQQWHSPAVWHSAFSSEATTQQISKGGFELLGCAPLHCCRPAGPARNCRSRGQIVDIQSPCFPPLSADSKVTVSHSTIEKQRRDRINSLIDEVSLCKAFCKAELCSWWPP